MISGISFLDIKRVLTKILNIFTIKLIMRIIEIYIINEKNGNIFLKTNKEK